jgi:pimeloyl-ACP methyl ester carboxylesterase
MGMRTLCHLFLCLSITVAITQTAVAQPPKEDAKNTAFDPLAGIYECEANEFVSLAIFDPGDGENRLLFTDFTTGVIRILAPAEKDVFTAGPGLLVPSPIEARFTSHRNESGEPTSVACHRDGAPDQAGTKVNCTREAVTFRNGSVTLSGTLVSPAGNAPHSAVIFLHGSGPLNRWSFGPFPDFFLSRGFAVLLYDKRGTGTSKGDLASATLDDLAGDGRAAVQFLKNQKRINPRKIGVCGVSQGGFLAAAVARANADVAFIVDLYGMYVPVWQQELYRTEAEMRAAQLPEAEITEALAFTNNQFTVAKTGLGWDEFAKTIQQAKGKKWWDHVTKGGSSLKELRDTWRTLYSYDPSLALEKVTCPVLALFGELDTSTPVAPTITNMQRALTTAKNANFTHRTFSKAGHGLLEVSTGAPSDIAKSTRLAPGLLEAMTTFLGEHHSK